MRTRLRSQLIGAPALTLTMLLGTPHAWATAGAEGAPDAGTTPDATAPTSSLAQAMVEREAPARVGEVVTMTVTMTHPPGARITPPQDTGKPRWAVVGARQTQTPDGDEGATSTTLELDLMAWRPGPSTLPALEVAVTSSDGGVEVLKTEPVEVKVLTGLKDDEVDPKLADAKPPVPIYEYDYAPAYYGGGAAALALVGLLGFAIARRRMRAAQPPPPPPPIHVVALERLSGLATQELTTRPEFVLFYIQLSEIVRDYLGKRFGFPGTELTTTEIMERLEHVRWPAGLAQDDVQTWLDHCDRVKFAGHTPEQGDAEGALRRAFSFVELTRHIPEEPPEAPPQADPGEDAEADDPEAKAEHEAKVALGGTALGGFSFDEVEKLSRGESLEDEEEE